MSQLKLHELGAGVVIFSDPLFGVPGAGIEPARAKHRGILSPILSVIITIGCKDIVDVFVDAL